MLNSQASATNRNLGSHLFEQARRRIRETPDKWFFMIPDPCARWSGHGKNAFEELRGNPPIEWPHRPPTANRAGFVERLLVWLVDRHQLMTFVGIWHHPTFQIARTTM
jgi:hypothetical protein